MSETTCSSNDSSPSIDIEAHPHILSLILEYCTTSVTAKILLCSKSTFAIAAAQLYQTIRVTAEELTARVTCGTILPSYPSPTAFSPSFRYYLQCIRTLHLLDYEPDNIFPSIPEGCFDRLVGVILHVNSEFFEEDIELPTIFNSLRASHLYVCLNFGQICDLDRNDCVTNIHNLPTSFRRVTLLVPCPSVLWSAPTCVIADGESHVDRQISIVLLPGIEAYEELLEDERRWGWSGSSAPAAHSHPKHPVRYIGFEHMGMRRNRLRLLLSPALSAQEYDKAAAQISFMSTGEWLDEEGWGGLYTFDESMRVWLHDLKSTRHLLEKTLKKLCEDAELLSHGADFGFTVASPFSPASNHLPNADTLQEGEPPFWKGQGAKVYQSVQSFGVECRVWEQRAKRYQRLKPPPKTLP